MKVDKAEILQLIKDTGVAADIEKIENSTSLEKVGLDSLDMANMLFAIEERYEIKIFDEEIENLDSINSIAKLLNSK